MHILNKEVCIMCWNKDKEFEWESSDESNWRSRYIFCRARRDFILGSPYQDILEKPSKECYYKLEHILKEAK
jgi:hypothetical protein